jgi:hypothetical protein
MVPNWNDIQDFSWHGILQDRLCHAGLSDYQAENVMNSNTGVGGAFVPSGGWSRFLALYTTAPTSDAGTGGTEVVSGAGTGYQRVQFAGTVTCSGSFTTSSTSITLNGAAAAWITSLGPNGSGVNIYDITAGAQIGVASGIAGTTIGISGTSAHNSSTSADVLQLSAFIPSAASSGTEPLTAPASAYNNAAISMYASAVPGSWGTLTSWGVYDASGAGNFITWDYLGSNKWIPFSCTSATPGVLTCDSTADAPANGSNVVVTQKFGGTLPTTGGSWAGLLTTANLASNTFTAGVNTTGVGGGQFRQVQSLTIGSGIGPISFAASALTISVA